MTRIITTVLAMCLMAGHTGDVYALAPPFPASGRTSAEERAGLAPVSILGSETIDGERLDYFVRVFSSYEKAGILSEEGERLLEIGMRLKEEESGISLDELNRVIDYFIKIPEMTGEEIKARFPQEYFREIDADSIKNLPSNEIRLKLIEGCGNLCITCPVQDTAKMRCMPYPLVIMLARNPKTAERISKTSFLYEPLYYEDISGALCHDVAKVLDSYNIITRGSVEKHKALAQRNIDRINASGVHYAIDISVNIDDKEYHRLKESPDEEIVRHYVQHYLELIEMFKGHGLFLKFGRLYYPSAEKNRQYELMKMIKEQIVKELMKDGLVVCTPQELDISDPETIMRVKFFLIPEKVKENLLSLRTRGTMKTPQWQGIGIGHSYFLSVLSKRTHRVMEQPENLKDREFTWTLVRTQNFKDDISYYIDRRGQIIIYFLPIYQPAGIVLERVDDYGLDKYILFLQRVFKRKKDKKYANFLARFLPKEVIKEIRRYRAEGKTSKVVSRLCGQTSAGMAKRKEKMEQRDDIKRKLIELGVPLPIAIKTTRWEWIDIIAKLARDNVPIDSVKWPYSSIFLQDKEMDEAV